MSCFRPERRNRLLMQCLQISSFLLVQNFYRFNHFKNKNWNTIVVNLHYIQESLSKLSFGKELMAIERFGQQKRKLSFIFLNMVRLTEMYTIMILYDPVDWSTWEQFVACQTLCVSEYQKQTQECCTTGSNLECYSLPVKTLEPFIGTCPG